MAIIACKECAREVSDKAACCPHCGVSIAGLAQRKPRPIKPWLYGTMIAGLLVWGALTTLWLMGISPVPRQLADLIGLRSRPVSAVKAPQPTVEHTPAPTVRAALELRPASSAIYRTNVEQLYQDYDENEVAIQNKIGDSPVRVSGVVAEIVEDTSGRPVVTLHTGSDNRADMLLTDDQRSAAAQLSKEEAVEIQCNKMQRVAARLHGSGCALVLVEAGAKPVYLAVSLSSKTGSAPLYIVGPMSRNTCLASSDTIAVQVTPNSRSERILSKSCAATTRESVSLDGCHLSSTMAAIPDIPSAHLWKYDCMAAPADARRTADTAPSKSNRNRAAAQAAAAGIGEWQLAPASAVAEPESNVPAPKAPQVPQESASNSAAPNPPEPALIKTAADVTPVPIFDSNPGAADGAAAPAVANSGTAGGPQQPTPGAGQQQPTPGAGPVQPTPGAGPSSTATAAVPPAAVADDLAPVRTKDPEAADRIVSYCSKLTSSATDPTTVAARCRRDEMAAWTRLISQNEFPTLDETTRRKCSEPPFPDSYVAQESCAKYQLHLD
jgi:hypothetical protein